MVYQLGASESNYIAPSESGGSGGIGNTIGALLRGGASAVGSALQGGVSYGSREAPVVSTGGSQLQQALAGQAQTSPVPAAMANPQFSKIENAQAVTNPQAMLQFNGKQVPMGDLLASAYKGPQPMQAAPGNSPWADTATDATNATRQDAQSWKPSQLMIDAVEAGTADPSILRGSRDTTFRPIQMAPPVEQILGDINKSMGLEPSFNQPIMPPQGPPNFSGQGGNATPVDYNPPASSYANGSLSGLPLPGRAEQPQMARPELEYMTPELAQQLLTLKKTKEFYRSILKQGDPYDKAVQYFNDRTPNKMQKFFGALATGLNGGPIAPIKGAAPRNLEEYLSSHTYQQQRALFDDAQNKYAAADAAITALEKDRAVKKFDLAKEMEAAKVVPAGVRLSIIKEIAKEPTYLADAEGVQIPNLQKMQQIDLLINEGLLKPEDREASFKLYSLSEKTEQDRKNQEFASKMLDDAIKRKSDNLKYTKLTNSMQIDMNIKKARLAGIQVAAQLAKARMENIPVAHQEKLDSARRQIQRIEIQQAENKRKADAVLAQERLNYAKIAGSTQNGFYTQTAINEAKKNVAMIDGYMAGKFSLAEEAANMVTAKPMGPNAFMALMLSNDPNLLPLQKLITEKASQIAVKKRLAEDAALAGGKPAPNLERALQIAEESDSDVDGEDGEQE